MFDYNELYKYFEEFECYDLILTDDYGTKSIMLILDIDGKTYSNISHDISNKTTVTVFEELLDPICDTIITNKLINILERIK